MQLMADSQMAGQLVKCPGCNSKLQVPAGFEGDSHNVGGSEQGGAAGKHHRNVWKEQDPTNPNSLLSVGIGFGITIVWFAIIYFFQAPASKVSSEFTTGETLANLFYKHFTVSFANTLFFCWAAAICYLKMLKLKHQRQAMLLDVLPRGLGEQINVQNVGTFIDHVYGLPERLRDSLMVNRIRKALEFFESRQNVADVSSLMGSQSAIDGSRIMGSYILIRAFLWAIPLLGFIGTVIGLSHAISGMSFSNVEDVSKIVGSINNVTSGLGTAFDATLLGLVFAVVLNFPLNSLAKHEEEALNDIDAFCNEVLLPRLDDGASGGAQDRQSSAANDMGTLAEAVASAITASQREFLADLNTLSARMLDYASTLEGRNEQYQQAALQHLSEQVGAVDARTHEHFEMVRQQQEGVMNHFSASFASLEQSSREAYEAMVHSQNSVVDQFTEKVGALSSGVESLAKSQMEAVADLAHKLESMSGGVQKALSSSVEVSTRAMVGMGEHLSKLDHSSKDYQQAVHAAQQEATKLFADKIGVMSAGLGESLQSSVQLTQKTISGIEAGIGSLNTVLEKLSKEQVVVQQVQKKGWFGRS